METFKKLPREEQAVLGGALLYLIFSFFDWQQVSAFGVSAGISEWHGVGVVAGLLVIALLVWEAARVFSVDVRVGSLSPGLVSVALALLLLLFTVITFLTHNEFRHWPSWLGLILSIVIAAAALGRARREGVEMPDLSALQSRAQGGEGGGARSTTATPPAAPDAAGEEPPATPGTPEGSA